MRSCISGSGSVFAISGSRTTNTNSGTGNPAVLASSPAINSAISALVPCPAPRNLSTYIPSSSASMIAGSDPPSRNGVTYLVAVTVLILFILLVPQRNQRIDSGGAPRGDVARQQRGDNHTE